MHCTPTQPTVIGEGVTVGHNVHIEGATIGDGALISSGSVVLNGATVGEGAVVAAGAVVSPNAVIPPRAMALGIPAQVREGFEVPAGSSGTTPCSPASSAASGLRAELRLLG